MCDAIRHRGPDDDGYFVSDDVALGMRRLSVIDIAGGAQPIANEDQTVHVVFNGEIYNHRQLASRLIHRHVLRSRSDTEVLVHLYEEHAEDLVHHLRGMFAFAIWDARRHRLVVARDRLGIKPLYYWPTSEGVAFASELRCFLALEKFSRRLNRRSIAEYLSIGYVPEPNSVFDGVYKLPPGHRLIWTRTEGIRIDRYWTPNLPEARVSDDREAIEELRRLVTDAVGSHLEADVPVGAFLSGGIDSSTVVAEMVRHSTHRVRTFSIGFDEPEYNEAPQAAAIAAALGTQHTELIVRPDADALVESVVSAYDEPFSDPSALPTLLVSQLAREQVTVALSGDGGDELFGGYSRYGELLHRSELRQPWIRAGLRAIVRKLPHPTPWRNRMLDLARSRRRRYGATVGYALGNADGGIVRDLSGNHANVLDELVEQWFEPVADRDFLTQMTLVDIASYLPGDILTKVDRASMRVSLEARVPLLDHPLVEFAVSLPGRMKHRGGVGKWALRQAVEGIVPPRVMTYPKRGFGVPLDAWLRNELGYRLDSLVRPDAPIADHADTGSIRRLINEHRAGRRNHGYFLWRLIVLDLWLATLRSGRLNDMTRQVPLSYRPVERIA
jgi:asparagine synthase (glutamine-hydrolysing)